MRGHTMDLAGAMLFICSKRLAVISTINLKGRPEAVLIGFAFDPAFCLAGEPQGEDLRRAKRALFQYPARRPRPQDVARYHLLPHQTAVASLHRVWGNVRTLSVHRSLLSTVARVRPLAGSGRPRENPGFIHFILQISF